MVDKLPLRPVSALSLIYLEPQTDFTRKELSNLNADGHFAMRFKGTAKPVEIGRADYIPSLLMKARETIEKGANLKHLDNCEQEQLLGRLRLFLG